MSEDIQRETNGRAPADAWGVVLLAHGSQRGNDTYRGLQYMVRRLQMRLGQGQAKVVMACLEFIEPNLPQAASALVDQGFRRITVMPFLLGQGTHSTIDLDEEIARALDARPGAEIVAAQSFGCDPALVRIVVDRVIGSIASINGKVFDASLKGVMLVKAGTRSPTEDHCWLRDLGERVEESLGADYAVSVAQSHFGPPTMDEAASELIEKRGVSSIVCVPYIFFPGLILTRNILGGIETLRQRYPHIPFSATPTLGIDDRLVELTARRVTEAWGSPSLSLLKGGENKL
jgi:sirohydrochlorin ferrochelatase